MGPQIPLSRNSAVIAGTYSSEQRRQRRSRTLVSNRFFELFLFRKADLPRVPDRRATLQVRFTDVRQLPDGSRESARAASDVRGITRESKARLREWLCRCYRGSKEDVVSRFRDPVMLHMKQNGAARPGLWRRRQRGGYSPAQISRRGPQSRVGIHSTKIRDDASAHVDTVAARGRLRLCLGRRATSAAGQKRGC